MWFSIKYVYNNDSYIIIMIVEGRNQIEMDSKTGM